MPTLNTILSNKYFKHDTSNGLYSSYVIYDIFQLSSSIFWFCAFDNNVLLVIGNLEMCDVGLNFH